jgi:hypothetical protein
MVLPLLYWRLPESVTFLVSKGADRKRILAIVRRLAPEHVNADTTFVCPVKPRLQAVQSAPSSLRGIALVPACSGAGTCWRCSWSICSAAGCRRW